MFTVSFFKMLYTSTHSTETEIGSDKLFKIVFHRDYLPLKNKSKDSDKVPDHKQIYGTPDHAACVFTSEMENISELKV